jgi:DNA-binding transcriptional LysR family regulator
VNGAAQQLFVTQPSVSAAVSALSRDLGVDLVERHGRGIRLTTAGEAFLPYAAEVLGLLGQGRLACQEASTPALVRVRVAAVNTAGEYLMPALIHAYRSERPGAEVLLEIGNRTSVLQRVEARDVDVGIAGRPGGRSIDGRQFLENELVVVARDPGAALRGATWLLREDGSGTRATTERYLSEHAIVPRDTLTLGSNEAVKKGVALGLGVTLMSRHAVARELRDGVLAEVAAPGTPLSRPWYTLVPKGVEARPAVREFLGFLHSEAARQAIDITL